MRKTNNVILKNLFTTIFLTIFILSQGNLIKAFILGGAYFIGISILYMIYKDYGKSFIYMIGLSLPINLILYDGRLDTSMTIAGASVGLVITFQDFLIGLFIINTIINLKNKNIKLSFKSIIFPLIYVLIHIFAYGFSINKIAALSEIIRLTKYIIFSLCIIKSFNLKKYIIFVIGLSHSIIIQLIIGILQILKGEALGIGFLGESTRVFREGVTGLEKGMSGTVGHPGTLAIFGVFCLGNFLFCKELKNRRLYIAISSLVIIITFARTSIILMCFMYFSYFIMQLINKDYNFKLSYKKLTFITLGSVIIIINFLAINFEDKFGVIMDRFTNSDFSEQISGRSSNTELALFIYDNNERWASGPNNYTYLLKYYFPIEYSQGNFIYTNPVHNLYVLYLIEIGVVGVLTYVFLNLINIYNLLIRINCIKKNKYRGMIIFPAIWSITILAYNFTGWSGAKDIIICSMWISIGISESAINRFKE